jgi:hypothetical protein
VRPERTTRIDFDLVAVADRVGDAAAFHRGQADVDQRAVEDVGDRFRDDPADAGLFKRPRRVLIARAHAEEAAGDENIARLHFVFEFRVDAAHDVLDIAVVDRVAELPDTPFNGE